jgi:hypothetical protein
MTTKASSTVDRKVVEIPKCMLDGEKFMKWDEVSQTITITEMMLITFCKVA